MKLITLHLAYLITFQISINGSSKREEIKKFLEVTKKTSFEFDSALSVAIELLWIELKGSGYVLSKSGARALSFGHWRLIQPTKIESAVLDRFEFGDFLLDKNTYKKRPKVIDLFAGVGGLSLGFESVGFEIVAAMDNDSQACEAHTKNFPMTKVIQDDINKFAKNPKLYLKNIGIADDIDGIIGGPPCQGFSNMGERVVEDDRNFLTTRFTDVVNGLKPKFFMMENVAGLKTIGIRPALDKYLIDLAKPIGFFAGEIAAALPDVSKNYAKRGPQFKKRLISTAVSNLKDLLFLEAQDYFDANRTLQIIKKSPKFFKDAFLAACEKECPDLANDHEWVTEALSSITCSIQPIHVIALGVLCEFRKVSAIPDLSEFLISLVKVAGKTKLADTLNNAIDGYRHLPVAEKFQGELIGPVLAGIINRVKESYEIYGPQVLNSYKFGAPQSRQRLFLIGIRKDIPTTFSFPDAIYGLPDKADTHQLSLAPTCEAALIDLPDIDTFPQLVDTDKFSSEHLLAPSSEYAKRMRFHSLPKDDWSLPRITWNPLVVDCCTRTIHSDDVVNRLKGTSEGIQDKKSGKTRLKRGGVSHTLRAGTKEEKGSHTAVRPVHYEHHRVISVREGARLMGFPDWMTFHPTKWHGFRLVGNAVPLQLGQSVATSIRGIFK